MFLGPKESGSDLGLMAHELTHVAQQGAAGQRAPQRRVQVGESDSPAEREADRVAGDVRSGAPPAQLVVDAASQAPGQMHKHQSLSHRSSLILCGKGDLGPLARSLHHRLLGPSRPFVLADPRRGPGQASVRSPMNRPTGAVAMVDAYAAEEVSALEVPIGSFTEAERAWVLAHGTTSLPEIEKAILRLVALRTSPSIDIAARWLGMATVSWRAHRMPSSCSLSRWIGRRQIPVPS